MGIEVEARRRPEPAKVAAQRKPPRTATTRPKPSRKPKAKAKSAAQGQRRAQPDPPRPLLELHHSMSEQILSQDEVDALLHGIAGDGDEARAGAARRRRASAATTSPTQEQIVRGRMPNLEIINERFARNLRIGLFNFIRKSPEISIGGIKVQQVQRLPARDRRCRPTSTSCRSGRCAAAASSSATRRWCSRSSTRSSAAPASYRTRIEGRDFSPTEQRIIQRLVEVVHDRIQHAPGPASIRSSSTTSARRCCRSSPPSPRRARSSSRRPSRSRSATPAAAIHFCIPVRDARADPRRALLDRPGRRRRARPALDQR